MFIIEDVEWFKSGGILLSDWIIGVEIGSCFYIVIREDLIMNILVV